MHRIALASWLALLGCSNHDSNADGSTDDGACAVGSVGCPCTPGGGCDAGLACLSDICVDPGSGPATNGPTATDATAGSTASDDATDAGPTTRTSADDASTTAVESSTTADDSTGQRVPVVDCGRIDVLFVVDNSSSMSEQQSNLALAMPGFVDALDEAFPDTDFHMLVTATDDASGGSETMCSGPTCTCMTAPTCCENPCGDAVTECNGDSCDALPIEACDYELGVGRRVDTMNNECIAGEARYIDESAADQGASLACAVLVGRFGVQEELQIQAMLEATSAPFNDPGGCNDGFVRDDALLVVAIVSTEDDDGVSGSPGDPADWAQSLAAVKNDDPGAIVALGLVGDSNLRDGLCAFSDEEGAAIDAVRIQEFVLSFPFGAIGSVCGSSFDMRDFLVDSVSLIESACDSL